MAGLNFLAPVFWDCVVELLVEPLREKIQNFAAGHRVGHIIRNPVVSVLMCQA